MGAEGRAGTRWEIGDEKNAADTVAAVRYDAPPGFTEVIQGAMTVLHEPAEEIIFIVLRTTRDAGPLATAELDQLLSTLIKDLARASEPSRGTYNGMRGMQMKLTGTYEGKPANVTMRLLEAQSGKYVAIAGAYLAAREEALKATFDRFFASVRSAA